MEYTDPPMPPALAPSSAPQPQPFWGRERLFGQLFSASFGMFGAHMRWLVPLLVTSLVPGVAWTLLAEDVFGYNQQLLMNRLMSGGHSYYSSFYNLDAGPSTETLAMYGLVGLVLTMLGSVFFQAAVLRTLAEAGRGKPITLGAAFENGLRGFGTYFVTALWVGLRVIPWLLLFFVPGIIKSIAWMFALPARMAGDTDGAERSIGWSNSATDGRKGYLFLFLFCVQAILMGISFILGLISGFAQIASGGLAAMHQVSGTHQVVTVITTFLGGAFGVVVTLGAWLAYADAVALKKPDSPAAAYALGVTGRPFPVPNFRGE